MRLLPTMIAALSLSAAAQANQPTQGCDFRFWGSTQPIPGVEGYKVTVVPAEFQMVQVYGQTPARYRTERRPAWDGGPMEIIKTEIRPASNSRMQRKQIRPAYFIIKDKEDQQVGWFEKPADAQNYVCSVIIPTFGNKK